jgi:hypothetical protein
LELHRRDIAGRSKLITGGVSPRLPSFFSFVLDAHLYLPCAKNPSFVARPSRALPSVVGAPPELATVTDPHLRHSFLAREHFWTISVW